MTQNTRPRAREAGERVGILPAGALNAITDVAGVRVGHRTIVRGREVRTGVTAVLPHGGNLFREKVPGAVYVGNGFGKLAGSTQVEELGEIETPILLTSTLSVPRAADALVEYMITLPGNEDVRSVNPLVGETNDGFLNDIRGRHVAREDVFAAIREARAGAVEEGAVGAGTGTIAFGFKGGIGTSSRRIELDQESFHLGVLVLSNFGRPGDLRLPDGRFVGPYVAQAREEAAEKGSIIVIAATNIPLSNRQLERVLRRTGVGLARLGSFWGHGSGDIALGFTTGTILRHDEKVALVDVRILNESRIDLLFEAMADATQEAVLDALVAAGPMTGRDGHHRPSLADILETLLPKAPTS
jgi:D-aminopeptidase